MTTEKARKFERVAQAIAALLSSHGVRGITISAVARKAGVSRPWVYKYVGRDSAAVLAFAVQHFAAYFAELGSQGEPPEGTTWETWMEGGLGRITAKAAVNPAPLRLYFQFAAAPNRLGELLAPALAAHRRGQRSLMEKRFSLGKDEAQLFSLLWDAIRLGAAFEASIAGEGDLSDSARRSLADPRLGAALLQALRRYADS